MVIQEIAPQFVLALCRKTLGLPETHELKIEDTLLANLLRRAAGYLTPCSRTGLRAAVMDSLQKLSNDSDLSDRIDNAIDWLLIGGDLLELRDVTTSDALAKGTWVYPAPPSFVVRPSGSIFLIGTTPDQDSFLPVSLMSRIRYEGFSRVIYSSPDENLEKELKEYGLQQLPETMWLKAPREESLNALLESYQQLLESQGPSGQIEDLTIIDSSASVLFYKGRWTKPKASHSGIFIGRRPQEFRAPIWGLALLKDGQSIRFLDLPKKHRSRWLGSDEAWLIQMALDSERSTPQRFRMIQKENEVQFDFFSPLPSWAQRRLMILGRSVLPQKCLMSFVLASDQAETEEQFLRKRLWLAKIEE